MEHVWRAPFIDEPQEVGCVCVLCGCYGGDDGENDPCPCDSACLLDSLELD